ncbi:transporter substrate-binding domain-containing protein [Maridesulfovibrio salexigens]|uniref:Extracellular solute-binding protein family 3 n=1 Tax=Maridesulfovibrio salexigens (strain ATCC 14822 / DSM 2638 / NCIMB 8403 / VKM B-1763) TaxID=526222 RepID=C6C149_MARSD|nr:transporter substrate-binding domain-containing protein [Maridesulfovibrio salexigens]ACS79212.1 extracellular solute-binding protein family 3 [Maridesulfovibrio salexigens DSM 2638]
MNKSILLSFIAAILILLPAIAAASTPLIITHSSSMPPLAFINKEGEPDGVLIDFWKEWSEQVEVEIIFKLQPWKEAVQETVNGKADINGGMFYSESRAKKLLYGDYLFHIKGSLFTTPDIIVNDQIADGQSCGVIKADYSKIFMEEHFPYTKLMLFNSAAEMFNAAAEGRVKAFVADYPVAIYLLSELGIANSFKCVKDLYTRNLYPTVGRHNPDLIKRINLDMAAIPQKRKKTIINKWLDFTPDSEEHRKTAAAIVFLALIAMTYIHRNEIRTAFKFVKDKLV